MGPGAGFVAALVRPVVGHGARSGIARVRASEPERVVILIISLDIWLQVNISGDATQLLPDDNVFKENFRDRALFLSLWFEGFDTGAAFGTRRQYVESFQKRRP